MWHDEARECKYGMRVFLVYTRHGEAKVWKSKAFMHGGFMDPLRLTMRLEVREM